MLNRRNLAVSLVLVLLLTMLAGCAMGDVQVPDRPVEMSMDAAMSAQQKAMAGLLAGKAEWTEAEFSSLVTELIKQNMGETAPVKSVTAWFTPEKLFLSVELANGITARMAGNVMIQDNRVMVDLSEAAAMGMTVSGPLLDVVEGAINRALNDPSMGVAASVEMGDGTLSVGIGQ